MQIAPRQIYADERHAGEINASQIEYRRSRLLTPVVPDCGALAYSPDQGLYKIGIAHATTPAGKLLALIRCQSRLYVLLPVIFSQRRQPQAEAARR